MASYVLRNALLRFVVMLFDDDCYFSSSVPFLQIPESIGDFRQAESPIDNRCYLPACHEVPQRGQILSVRSRQEDDQLLAMVDREPQLTTQTIKILRFLMSGGQSEFSGAEIARSTKLASGTLYPILLRLEEAGWAESKWEAGDPRELGRPRRRFYKVTGIGASKARTALQEMNVLLGALAWR